MMVPAQSWLQVLVGMPPGPSLVLLAASFAGGAINAVAGGGSFLAFPALFAAGISPVVANATTTAVMWPGTLASAMAYRRELAGQRGRMARLSLVSIVGGVAGAALLLGSSNARFLQMLPLLMLLAALAFTFSDRLARGTGEGDRAGGAPSRAALLAQLLIATYGGYFGGGMGILMLSSLAITGMRNLHAMNAVKCVLGALINAVAIFAYWRADVLAFRPGLAMAVAAVAGGYGGAALARRTSQRWVRAVVLAVAWGMTGYYAWRQYGFLL